MLHVARPLPEKGPQDVLKDNIKLYCGLSVTVSYVDDLA